MKTQVQNKLNFKKSNVTELSNSSLRSINGGSVPLHEGDIGVGSRFTSRLCGTYGG